MNKGRLLYLLAVLLVFLLSPAGASDIPITVLGSTQTQIVIKYTATTSGPCAITVTGSDGHTVNDLDLTKFGDANQDLSRTSLSAFRWPTLVSGLTRTVVIGGHDEVKQGSDGKWYSTALQVATSHTIAVSCNGGADRGTVQASTSNIPQGSTYPELPIPAPRNPNPGYPAPTIDWNDRTVPYIDPITGVLMRRVTAPLEITEANASGQLLSFAYDVTRSAWKSPNNALTNRQAGTLASTSTPNAPLFLASNSTWFPYCCGILVSDEQIVLYGQGANGTEIAEVCWSEDSGQSCASAMLDSVVFSRSAGVQSSLPASYPSNQFSSWGVWNKGTGQYDLGNRSLPGINASGSVVTMASLGGSSGFNTDRAPGSQLMLSNCSNGADIQLTVAHVDSPLQITVAQSGLNHTNCTYQDYASGVRIVLKNAGTLSLSATYNVVVGTSASGGVNGARDVCNLQKVTDIQTDCDGHTQNPPLSGQMCQMLLGSEQAIYLVQDNGRICLQSVGKHDTIRHLYALANPWLDAKSWMGTDGSNLWRVTKTDTDYTEYVPGVDPVNDVWTYVNASASATPLGTQITNAGGTAASDLATGLWGSYGINGIIGGYIQTAYQPGGDNAPCFRAVTDGAFNLVLTYDSWRKYPLRWGGCHSGPFGSGNYQLLGVNSLANFNSGKLLGGPFVLPVTAIRRNGTFQNYSIAITSGTAGTPTTLFSPNHDLANRNGAVQSGGPYATCSGGTGSWAVVNGTFHAHILDNNSFTLPVTTSGDLSGSITCQFAPPLATVAVGAISDESPPVVTITADNNYKAFIPDGRSMFQDGDPIVFAGLSQTQQYYAKATGYASNTFAVYTDATLATPAPYSAISAAIGNTVAWAEACPSTDAATLMPNGKLYFDSGNLWDAAPLIRCVTVRVRSQPCSEFPAAGEAAHYPCLTNAAFSSLQNIQPGDTLYDLSSNDVPDHERMLVLSVSVNDPASIDLTLMRWYGNDPSWEAGGYGVKSPNASPTGTACCVKSPGWTPYVVPTLGSDWFDVSDHTGTPQPEPPPYGGVHHDLGEGGPAPGLVNLAAAPAGYDDIWNVPFMQFLSAPVTRVHNSMAVWARDQADTMFAGPLQSYPSHRQANAPLSEQIWKADVSAVNGSYGFDAGNVDNSGIGRAVTKIKGFNYVYQITNPAPSGVTNIKIVPYLMTSGTQYFQDISGPSDCAANPSGPNCITDNTIGKYCEAFKANECVSGSSAGSFYFASQIMYDTGTCYSNNQTIFSPCLYPLGPMAGWIEQIRQTPIDLYGTGVRRLSMGWSLPLQHFSFYNWIASPDGKWGFFTANPVGQKPMRNSIGSASFAMKLPPWPAPRPQLSGVRGEKAEDRTTFIPYQVSVAGGSGDAVRIEFGYGENGNVNEFFCTTRLETCWTSATATPANPFLFDSESQHRTECSSGCVVRVPAIPGRLLYYRVEHSDGNTDPLQVVALP